jgi:uncharacterized membrane protein YphA (DoxX/SURF4 family)
MRSHVIGEDVKMKRVTPLLYNCFNGELMNRDSGILFFRISMGSMMILHGIMKIVGGLDFIQKLGAMPPFVPNNPTVHLVLGVIAVLFEIVGGLGIVTGFRFKTACIMIIMIMIPAFLYHLGNVNSFVSLMKNSWPLEIAFVFFAFFLIGPGRYKMR